jgi:hypothetical protein
MGKASFRFDASGLKKKLQMLGQLKANDLRYELFEFMRKTLTTASRNTPARDYSLIRAAQSNQYDKRVNCIPSSHELKDPSLRVKGKTHWLFFRGKWLNASDWKLSNEAWAAYQPLLSEHTRRKQTSRSNFIKGRAQARFLYRKSWLEAADSLGVEINVAQTTRKAVTRRKPAVNPPKASGQVRGGAKVLAITISNPFLEQPSRYKDFSGKRILAAAQAQHEGAYKRAMTRRLKRLAKRQK